MDNRVLKLLTKIIRNKYPNIDSIQIIETGDNYSKPFFEVRIYMNVITYDFNPNLERMIYSLFIPHMGDVLLHIYYER